MNENLSMYTVYWNANDYPNKYVVRRWEITSDGHAPREIVIVANTLEEARQPLQSLFCLPRQPGDESHIVEVWL